MKDATNNPLNVLAEALNAQTAAIGSLVATLTPKQPDHVGTGYLAERLGCSPTWVARMAERGDIPRDCVVPKVSGGRIWKFHRTKVDQWLSQKGHE